MLVALDYGNLVFQIFLFLLSIYTWRKAAPWKDPNPIVVANFLIVFVDTLHLFIFITHDYLARIYELESFGRLGVWIYLCWNSSRYYVQLYTFIQLPILHLFAILLPGHYRKLHLKGSLIIITIPITAAIIAVTVHSIVCNCITYQIPGYYISYTPGKEAIADVFTNLDHGTKAIMYLLLLGTDVLIIAKLYKMRVLGRNKKRPVEVLANNNTNNSTNNNKATASVTLPPIQRKQNSRLKVALDIRLAIAFFYIAIVNSLFTVYVVCISIFPVQAIPYLNVLIYDLDLSKCTIYVLIVMWK